jgi:hypothetical protein
VNTAGQKVAAVTGGIGIFFLLATVLSGELRLLIPWAVMTPVSALAGYDRRAALLAVVSVLAAGVALAIDEPGPRPLIGLLALAAAVASRFWKGDHGAVAPGFGRFCAMASAHTMAAGGGLVGAAFVVGWLIKGREAPISYFWMYAGLLLLGGGFVYLIGAWVRTFARDVLHEDVARRWILLACGSALGVALLVLAIRDIPNERTPPERESQLQAAREAVRGRYDLLLVVDPADRLGRELILAAQRATAPSSEDPYGFRSALLLRGRTPAPARDVAFGLVVPLPGGEPGEPLYRLVESPSDDPVEVVEAIARIPLREGAPAYGSYGRLLHDEFRVRWRRGARRGIAFLLERLPTLEELDPGPDEPGAAAGGGLGRERRRDECAAFATGELREIARESAVEPVPWEAALERICRGRQSYRDWELVKRDPEFTTPPPLVVHAVTRERRRARLAAWRGWTRPLGGRVHAAAAPAGLGGAVDLLGEAHDLQVEQPVGELARVARAFRPYLFFDTDDERLRPVDVDWMLAPLDRLSHRTRPSTLSCGPTELTDYACEVAREGTEVPFDRVCDRGFLLSHCENIATAADLGGSLDEAIDFADKARRGPGGVDPPRMYVHVREEGDRVYLGYWWFERYNVSPWRTEVNCLPGLTFGAVSCHDHQGDWEGVTVVLRRLDHPSARDPYVLGNLLPEEAVYEAHGHPVRWRWDQIELAAEDSAHLATHPVVYVAVGSHASYPRRCLRKECDQSLSGSSIGEGGFDGRRPWRYNREPACDDWSEPSRQDTIGPCLLALPSTDGGRRPMLWNAFPGAWGRAQCTVIAKVCSQVDGPRSPGAQTRFTFYKRSSWRVGPERVLRKRRRLDLSPRWEPTEDELRSAKVPVREALRRGG